ncbi:hypothetical protein OPKNFCMD_1853 [Methylobacterium crusticola]|uniref:Uncharacterized protein n=1 Tax=Methylobacterium crusticola TaxID=1697972 RepID=A0ABQ4QUV8_9HYPH|nr:hypothetical protein [Methylobacterium crusticola]GJD49123.1 hypothetical protein OPKNFCMD_1853 [Methylobacterium crusticola]
MSAPEGDVPAARLTEALDHLLRTPPFVRSPKLARFLRFVVEEELAGRGLTIKAYTIATQALGRGSDFDPSLDPSVRVEAGRLRRALEEAYARHGDGIVVRISVPVGGYRPAFERLDAAPEPIPPPPAAPLAAREAPVPPPVPSPSETPPQLVIGLSPRGQTAIIALLAGILVVLCLELAATLVLHMAAGTEARPRDVAERVR